MPTYVYRAMTKTGLIVKNKIESPSKQNLLKLLKSNELIPIDVEQIRYIGKQQKKAKKNIANIEEIMKNLNTTNIGKNKPKQFIFLMISFYNQQCLISFSLLHFVFTHISQTPH